MKDFLIGMGIGFAVGAILAKSNKTVGDTIDKGKKMIEEKAEEIMPKKQSKQPAQSK